MTSNLFKGGSKSAMSPMSSQLFSSLQFDDVDDDVNSILTPQSKKFPLGDSPLIETDIGDSYKKLRIRNSAKASTIQRRYRSFESRRSLFKRRIIEEDSKDVESPVKRACPNSPFTCVNVYSNKVPECSPAFKKDETRFSSNSQDLIERALEQNCLTGDGQSAFCLPTVEGKHHDLNSISPDTLSDLLNGAYDHVINSYRIIDCRYPYEYEGGHIKGAENVFTEEGIIDVLHSNSLDPFKSKPIKDKPDILIFHCEFSSERGPNKCRFLRNMDRKLNADNYPFLNFPEVYLLHGGYKDFFAHDKSLCDPSTYTPMLHKGHSEDLRTFRKKSKSWTAGEKRRHAMHNLRF